jgi:LEA14-like dessication related protein
MKKLPTPLCLLAGVALFLGGCASVGDIVTTGLRVELTGLERTADGSVAATWRVVNPNVTAYLLATISNKIYLNGTLVGTAVSHDPLGLPPHGEAVQTGRLTLAGAGAEKILGEAAGHGPVGYKVDSLMVVEIYGEETEKGTVTHTGTVAVSNK